MENNKTNLISKEIYDKIEKIKTFYNFKREDNKFTDSNLINDSIEYMQNITKNFSNYISSYKINNTQRDSFEATRIILEIKIYLLNNSKVISYNMTSYMDEDDPSTFMIFKLCDNDKNMGLVDIKKFIISSYKDDIVKSSSLKEIKEYINNTITDCINIRNK